MHHNIEENYDTGIVKQSLAINESQVQAQTVRMIEEKTQLFFEEKTLSYFEISLMNQRSNFP